MTVVYLGLGANLGDRQANLQEAVRRLSEAMTVTAVSTVYETEPVGYRDQPDFLNLALAGETTLSPIEVLKLAKQIEADLGRMPSFRNAPRPIDIDILLYDELTLVTADLTIPHPRLHERAFVLVPLAEIAPAVRHPILGQTIATLRQALMDPAGVRVRGPLFTE